METENMKIFEDVPARFGTILTDLEGLKKMALEFTQAMPELNQDSLDNGWKCFGIAWLNMECKRGEVDRVLAQGLFDYVMRKYNERDLQLAFA